MYNNLSLSIVFVNIKFTNSIDFPNFFCIISDMRYMEGLTIREMAENLGLGQPAVKMRLRIAGIKPVSYAGPTALYDPSAQEKIRNVPSRGRPKKIKKP
jgi:hypothetical protein